MKICYIITKSSWGGAQRYLFEVATSAQANGHSVSVLAGGDGTLIAKLKEVGVETKPLPDFKNDINPIRALSNINYLSKVLKESKPDIVHLNSSKAGVVGALAARKAGVSRIFFTAHGWAFNDPSLSIVTRLIAYPIHWLTILLSHKTIAVSYALKKQICFLPGTQRKLEVIHNGVADISFIQHQEARLKIAEVAGIPPRSMGDTFLIGSLAELHPVKGLETLLCSLSTVITRHPNVKVVIFGEGKQRAELEKSIQKKNLTQMVYLPGFNSTARELLKGFDLFALPSYSEALAYAILEAGRASLPVVASRVGGIPEIITSGENGYLVPKGDSLALAEALLSLIEDEVKRKTFGEGLHKTVSENFSQKQMVEKTLALYL